MKTGVFLSDVHMPDNIPLAPILSYVKDLKPNHIILGGDIIDAKGLHGADSLRAEQVKIDWFKRDVKLASGFIEKLRGASPSAEVVYLAGNHEDRYEKLRRKYPDLFWDSLDFQTAVKDLCHRYIPYGAAESYYKLGDTVFIHGNIFPDLHAKPYALRYTPNKVIYGHMHHFQSYTTHRALIDESTRYAVTAGCLCTRNPDWKYGQANQWVNGFVSFVTDGKVTIPTVHLIERGKFLAGSVIYG